MRRHLTEYHTEYCWKDLVPEALESFRSQVEQGVAGAVLYRVTINFVTNRKRFKETDTLTDLKKAYYEYPNEIGYFSLAFHDTDYLRNTSEFYPTLDLVVYCRGARGNISNRRICLTGYGCERWDFLEFKRIAEGNLGLVLDPTAREGFEYWCVKEDYERFMFNTTMQDQVLGSIRHGQYDAALRTAFCVVEDALRRKCMAVGKADALHQQGGELAVTAFHKDAGCLRPPWPFASEAQQGAQLMFQGFFQYLRNALIHNAEVMGKDAFSAYKCLIACEFLMTVVEKSTPRQPQA